MSEAKLTKPDETCSAGREADGRHEVGEAPPSLAGQKEWLFDAHCRVRYHDGYEPGGPCSVYAVPRLLSESASGPANTSADLPAVAGKVRRDVGLCQWRGHEPCDQRATHDLVPVHGTPSRMCEKHYNWLKFLEANAALTGGVAVPSNGWLDSCDYCASQEDGGHYCLLHSRQMKNMDTLRCSDWTPKPESEKSNPKLNGGGPAKKGSNE